MNQKIIEPKVDIAKSMTHTSSTRLRSNLLHKLGIHGVDATQSPPARNPSRASLLGGVSVTNEPLKYQSDEEDGEPQQRQDEGIWSRPWLIFRPSSLEANAVAASPTSTTSSVTSTSDKRLTFNDHVAVIPIPMREEYSDRVRDRLWNNVEEIHLNAQRNAVEFAAEGWDWRTVTEDEYMYRCAQSGELIHPVHFEPIQH